MFTQVGRALRTPGKLDVLGTLQPKRFVAMGESQSAFQMTTYVDAIQPIAHVYDGFFVHAAGAARSRSVAATSAPASSAPSAFVRTTTFRCSSSRPKPTSRASATSRPGNPTTRISGCGTYPGAAHADTFIAGGDSFGVAKGFGCKTAQVNTAPTHYIATAALHQLNEWIRTGTPRPRRRA